MLIRFFTVLVLVLTLALVGCGGLQKVHDKQRGKAFESGNMDFMQRLRWKDIQGASKHISEPKRKAFRDQFFDQDDLKITDVRLESADFSKEGDEVESAVLVEYYRLPSMSVQTFRYKLRWTFFDAEQPTPVGWQITSDIPPLP